MSAALLATLGPLADVMIEETAQLERGGGPAEIAPLATAKLRLIGALELASAEQDRNSPDWLAELDGEERSDLLDAVNRLRQAAAANAAMLGRQIDLSNELVQAIAGEARRIGGNRQLTYRPSGRLDRHEGSAPVAVNTSL